MRQRGDEGGSKKVQWLAVVAKAQGGEQGRGGRKGVFVRRLSEA